MVPLSILAVLGLLLALMVLVALFVRLVSASLVRREKERVALERRLALVRLHRLTHQASQQLLHEARRAGHSDSGAAR